MSEKSLLLNDPSTRLIGIGIMTDTDNTGESVEAFYGDIVLKRAPH